MADRAPTAGAAPANQGQQQQEGRFEQIFGIIKRVFVIWIVSQLATKFFASNWSKSQQPNVGSSPSVGVGAPAVSNTLDTKPQQLLPAWPLGIQLNMHVYLSTSPSGNVFSKQWTKKWKEDVDEDLPHFVWENITYGDWNDKRVIDLDVPLPTSVQHNGSLWADIFLAENGFSPNPADANFNPEGRIHHVRKLLSRFMPRMKIRKEKSLLSGSELNEAIDEEEPEQPDVVVSHWHKNLTLALVSDSVTVPAAMPRPVAEHIQIVPKSRDETGTKTFYKPIIFPNDFWQLRSQHFEINETTPRVPLRIEYQPISYFKFQLLATMSEGFNEAAKQQGASTAEFDEIKRMLVETNPYLLMLTALVTVLHTVFEFLAFKNDVSHWRKKNELVGVSVRTIVANVFVQLVILLYLVDNNENTSWMILMGQGVSMAIEAWKVTKAVDIKVVNTQPGSMFPYKIDIKDKHVLSEDEKKTQEYDKLAFKYVSWVTIPSLLGYSIYSLIYETHRGWYSFIISTLTSFVYMFGFVQLIPQLIINYKLKSVAHMPMKAMVYKTLSTVVDDFFAFCIKMPILHRLACFRDDVVFLIFIYQRWIYRVDPKRVNEYGQVLVTDEDHAAGEKEETKKTK